MFKKICLLILCITANSKAADPIESFKPVKGSEAHAPIRFSAAGKHATCTLRGYGALISAFVRTGESDLMSHEVLAHAACSLARSAQYTPEIGQKIVCKEPIKVPSENCLKYTYEVFFKSLREQLTPVTCLLTILHQNELFFFGVNAPQTYLPDGTPHANIRYCYDLSELDKDDQMSITLSKESFPIKAKIKKDS